ncbi:MAG: hypothetical protein Q8927_10765 [Bacteroidota bacterium]|nr:hypothetical protein [Bacteroidota bacterium]MDP4216674.1 hypothetical protein [Bacteroidota bacterium]MDP4244222.1 hypothetical protein [Bacteroidota bacterium]MDP4253406.1 hypothetical protein [Bacteroidota bacterium]MDP4258882.1 hypothetical protein [Bacteroidota bacterium]
MFRLSHRQLFFWGGLLLILALYSLYNIFLVDTSYYFFIPRILRHFSGLGCVALVYAIGVYALGKYTVPWMMQVWHALHIFLLFVLFLFGILAWQWGSLPLPLHNLVGSLLEVLISPVLYVAMGILNTRLLVE